MRFVCITFLFSGLFAIQSHAESKGQMAASGVLGFFSSNVGLVADSNQADTSTLSGFYGLGGDFDYFLDSDMSVGGILRYYSTSDSIPGGNGKTEFTNTLTSLGGVFRAYLIDSSHWSFVGTTGLG